MNIELHNKNFYIKTRYNSRIIEILKSLNRAWWSDKYKIWIAKADIENLECLQKNFNYWQEQEYKNIYDLVALIDDPLKLEFAPGKK